MYKFIGTYKNPEWFIPFQHRLSHEGFFIQGFDQDKVLWKVTFPGYYCHRYTNESFTINLDALFPDEKSCVFECMESDLLASLEELGVDITDLRHFTYGNVDDFIEVIATHPPVITKVG